MKICIVCSSGGHLLQASQLKEVFSDCEIIWVAFKKEDSLSILKNENVVWAYYPTQRNYLNLVRNFILALKVYNSSDIKLVVSTGAGVAIPFFVLGKLLGKKTIFIESIARINNLSLTGKLLYHFSDIFIVQWPELIKRYPRAVYKGRLL